MVSFELFDRTMTKLREEIRILERRAESGEPATQWDSTLRRLEERMALMTTAREGCLGPVQI